jgi:hypothetical protein
MNEIIYLYACCTLNICYTIYKVWISTSIMLGLDWVLDLVSRVFKCFLTTIFQYCQGVLSWENKQVSLGKEDNIQVEKMSNSHWLH